MALQLKKLDISSIKDKSTIIYLGKRNVGISYLLKNTINNDIDGQTGNTEHIPTRDKIVQQQNS
jgi:hypothetical protein